MTKEKKYICRRRKVVFFGSATVEAAFIIPLVIFVIIAVIFLCGFLYNRIRLGMGIEECLFDAVEKLGSGCSLSESELESEFLNTNPKSAFFWCREITVKCRVEGMKAEIEAGLELDLPTEGLTGRIVSGLRSVRQQGRGGYRDRSEIQRRLAAAGRLLKRFKDQ